MVEEFGIAADIENRRCVIKLAKTFRVELIFRREQPDALGVSTFYFCGGLPFRKGPAAFGQVGQSFHGAAEFAEQPVEGNRPDIFAVNQANPIYKLFFLHALRLFS